MGEVSRVRIAPLVLAFTVSVPAQAADFVHEAELDHHADLVGQEFGDFGRSVAVSGDTAVVGAPRDALDDFINGSVYVFVRSAGVWALQQTLTPPPTEDDIDFGYSVSISGDTVVIGAPFEDTAAGHEAGAAHVFVRSGTTWTPQQTLTAPDGSIQDFFGTSVAVSGDTIVVGAFGHGTVWAGDGAAYVFVRTGTTWTEQQELTASDPAPGDSLGISVSIDADTAVIGANGDDTVGADAGSAYVFVRSGSSWSEQQKLVAPDGAAGDGFGVGVSISEDTAVVGAATADTPAGADAGAAYVFTRSGATWTDQQKLVAPDAAAGDQLGDSVSVSGDTAVVGAPTSDMHAADAGSAYVFVRSGAVWSEQQEFAADEGAGGDELGRAVSVSVDTVLVGGPLSDAPGGADAGRAWAFGRSGTVWAQQASLLGWDRPLLDSFGFSVSIMGDTAAIGVLDDTTAGGTKAGSVDVFVRSGSTWSEQQKLLAADGGPADYIGASVAVDGDTIAAGADGDDTPSGANAGSVYVFVRSGSIWTQQQKLVAPDGGPGDGFGGSVSLWGDTLVVGSPGVDLPGGPDAGSAYVFVRTGATWAFQQKLTASDGEPFDLFGSRVSISGDTAVVGARGDDTAAGVNAGSAYVFVRAGTAWTEQQHLLAVDGSANDAFGAAVSVSGDTAVVGAFGDDTPAGTDAGSAYVFVRSGAVWTQQQKLTASDGTADDSFGFSVSIAGDGLTIGAPYGDSPRGSVTGAAYHYARSGSTWTEQAKLWAPDAQPGDALGFSVCQSGDTTVAAALYDDTPVGSSSGSAHVFRGTVPVELQSFSVE